MTEFKGCSQRQALVNLTETVSLPTLTLLPHRQLFKLIALIPCPIIPQGHSHCPVPVILAVNVLFVGIVC